VTAGPRRERPVVGVTGGVGSGKSSFAAALAGEDWTLVSADEVAHEVLEEETIRQRLAAAFGPGILDAEGRIDRAALGRRVFASRAALQRHTAVVYPAIRERLAARLAAARQAAAGGVVLEAPTLYEAGCEGLVDRVVTVEAPLEARARRCSAARDWGPDEVRRREALTIGEAERRRRADTVVENDGDLDALRAAARRMRERLSASR
jgi:dephospho-CoA kinase